MPVPPTVVWPRIYFAFIAQFREEYGFYPPRRTLVPTSAEDRRDERVVMEPAFRSEIDWRGRGHIFHDLAKYVESRSVARSALALGGLGDDGHAAREIIAEGAVETVEVRILNHPAVGDDKAIGEIKIGPVFALAGGGRRDLLLKVRSRDQAAGPEDGAPFAEIVEIGRGQARRRGPERIPVGAILVDFPILGERMQHGTLDVLVARKKGVLHPQRPKDVFLVQVGDRFSSRAFDDLTEDNVVGVGGFLAGSRREIHP